MNDWDRDNLDFLLSCNWAEFEEFVESLYEMEDLQYAIDLIRRGISTFLVNDMEAADEVESVEDAKVALEKIMKMK